MSGHGCGPGSVKKEPHSWSLSSRPRAYREGSTNRLPASADPRDHCWRQDCRRGDGGRWPRINSSEASLRPDKRPRAKTVRSEMDATAAAATTIMIKSDIDVAPCRRALRSSIFRREPAETAFPRSLTLHKVGGPTAWRVRPRNQFALLPIDSHEVDPIGAPRLGCPSCRLKLTWYR